MRNSVLYRPSRNEKEGRYVATGFSCSVVAHAALLAIFLYSKSFAPAFPENQVVYSITLEGGKQIGGVTQVPKKEEPKVSPPPPKKVSAKPEEVKEPEKVEPKPEVKPEEKTKKPEPKEEEKKPTPKATPPPPKKSTPAPAKTPSLAEINKQLQQATQRYLGESTDAGGRGFGAAKVGGNSMGGGVIRPPEFFVYQQLLKRHVKGGWTWFDTSAELVAQVTFAISERGDLSNITLVKSSGNSGFDESVLRAVRKATPVPPPPATVYEFFKEVRMTFDPRE